jgi:hypothetical protein
MKRIFEICAGVLLATIIATVMAVVIIEWASGCGETYTDSKGVVHENACFIVTKSK